MKKTTWNNLKLAWKYVKPMKAKLIKYMLCSLVTMFISIIIPVLSARIIIELTGNAFSQFLLTALMIYVVENVRNLIQFLTQYYIQYIYREALIRLESDLGKEILKVETQCADQHGSGVFIQRLSNDASRIADIFNVLNIYISHIITDIGIFFAVFLINRYAFLLLAVEVIIIFALERVRVRKYNAIDKVVREKQEKVSSFVGELVRGMRDIKMLNAEDSFIRELNGKVEDSNQERYKMVSTDRRYGLARGALRDFFDLAMMGLLVFLITQNVLATASALIIYNYMGRVVSIINYVGLLMDKVKDFNLSSSRVFAIFDSEEFHKEKFGTIHLEKVNGDFEFQNVTFRYAPESNPVLNDLCFKVNANETVAFVGKSGAGKTTIFSLLCNMYQVNEGKITIDGIDIKKLDKESIRGNITIINQSPYIFNLSIRDNLKLIKENLTEEEMIKACKLACLDDFIRSLPDGYDTIIGEGGVNLSGGQKQRLAIARAFVQKTEIILFDEATSALDNETQSKIQQAIDNMKKEYTILIIAHRLSTVINSDRILFLNEGKIEAEGTHQTLLKTCSAYRTLYETELEKTKEE